MPTANMHTIHFSWTVLDGKIYTFGGGNWVGNGWKASNHAQRYDPATDTWEILPSLSEAKIGMEAVAVGNRIFVVGGEKMGLAGQSSQNPCSECIEIYEVKKAMKLSIQRREKQMHLSWEADSLTQYTLETCHQLTDNTWMPVPGQVWPSQTNQWCEEMSDTRRFYRLRIAGGAFSMP